MSFEVTHSFLPQSIPTLPPHTHPPLVLHRAGKEVTAVAVAGRMEKGGREKGNKGKGRKPTRKRHDGGVNWTRTDRETKEDLKVCMGWGMHGFKNMKPLVSVSTIRK